MKDKNERLANLRAWAHWNILNPPNEDQKEMAETVMQLFRELREARACIHEFYSRVYTEYAQRFDDLAMEAQRNADDWRSEEPGSKLEVK